MPDSDRADRVNILCQTGNEHETVLHALNRWLDYDDRQVFLDSNKFNGTEDAWNNAPAIFAPRHPDNDLIFEGKLKEALEQVGGRVCGVHSNATVHRRGQPRLSVKTTFTDPEVQRLYDEGKVAVSTAMRATFDVFGNLSEKVEPNHVLYFIPSDGFQPRDNSAMLLNAREVIPMTDEKDTTILSQIKASVDTLVSNLQNSLKSKDSTEDSHMTDEAKTDLLNQIEAVKTEFAAKLVEKDTQIANLTNQVAALTPTLDQIKTDAAAKEWDTVKNAVPVGLLHGEGREAELMKLYNENPKAFIADILPKMRMNLENAMKREGDRIVMTDTDLADMANAVEQAKANTGRR